MEGVWCGIVIGGGIGTGGIKHNQFSGREIQLCVRG